MQILYPEGRKKALTFSYDDGQIFDRKLVEIFNRYQVKATFHLNSAVLDHEGFITKKEVRTLYAGHEMRATARLILISRSFPKSR
jgi:peptidoglycan-N-acetylglucosamine deacetylase